MPSWDKMGRRSAPPPVFPGGRPEALPEEDLPGEPGDLSPPEDTMSQADLQRVVAEASRLLAGDPSNLLALWHRATARALLGEGGPALDDFTRLVEAAPGFAAGWREHGILLSDLFRFDEALRSLDRAAVLEPDRDVYLNRAIALCFSRRFPEAEWDLWKAVDLDPEDGNAYWDLAWMYAQRGDAASAVEALRFAARDEELFARRFGRNEVLYDVFLAPIRESVEFQTYVARLPPRPFAPEPAARVLRETTRKAGAGRTDAPRP